MQLQCFMFASWRVQSSFMTPDVYCMGPRSDKLTARANHRRRCFHDPAMHIIDISLPLRTGMAVYEGDPPFRSEKVSRVDPDDPATFNTSRLELGTHTGTHVDPPCHFDAHGAGAEALPLDVLCGPAHVLDLRGAGARIDSAMLSDRGLRSVERLLLRTDAEALLDGPFDPGYAHLTQDAARLIRDCGVRLVGIDAPSVEGYDSPGMPVHNTLLAEPPPIVVVESLDLRGVSAGAYTLYCLPLKLVGGDGAPARAILVRE